MGMGESEKTVKVFTVLYDGDPDGPSGPAGDGTFIKRFGPKRGADAARFASENTYYGKPSKVTEDDAPLRLARRWGLA